MYSKLDSLRKKSWMHFIKIMYVFYAALGKVSSNAFCDAAFLSFNNAFNMLWMNYVETLFARNC